MNNVRKARVILAHTLTYVVIFLLTYQLSVIDRLAYFLPSRNNLFCAVVITACIMAGIKLIESIMDWIQYLRDWRKKEAKWLSEMSICFPNILIPNALCSKNYTARFTGRRLALFTFLYTFLQNAAAFSPELPRQGSMTLCSRYARGKVMYSVSDYSLSVTVCCLAAKQKLIFEIWYDQETKSVIEP